MRNLRSLDLKLSLCVSALAHAIVFSIVSLRGDGPAARPPGLMPGMETVLEIRLEQDEPLAGEAQLARGSLIQPLRNPLRLRWLTCHIHLPLRTSLLSGSKLWLSFRP